MAKMRKALVSYPAENETTVEREANIITKQNQFPHYKELHPLYYPLVKQHFIDALSGGETIVVNRNGGWCTTGETIQIVKFLD